MRLDNPDLPDNLRIFGGEVLSQLWSRALQAAEVDLSSLREDARANTASARAESASLRELATHQGRIASMTEIVRETAQEVLRLRQALALDPPSER